MKFFSLLISSFAIIQMTTAGDEDILSNFIVPQNVTTVNGNFFTFTGLQSIIGSNPPHTFRVSKTSLVEFPALNMDSVSYDALQFPVGTTTPPHIHPCSAELLFLVDGALQVGFVDTTNKLSSQTLQKGDIFVTPKGLVHFQYNAHSNKPGYSHCSFWECKCWNRFNSPYFLLTTGIDDTIWLHPSDRRSPFKLSRLVLLPSLEDGTLYHQSNDFKTFPYSLVFNAVSFSNYYYFF